MATVGAQPESQILSVPSTGSTSPTPDNDVPTPTAHENRGGGVSLTHGDTVLNVNSQVIYQKEGGTVDVVPGNSLQQNNQRTDITADFSPFAAFPCHSQHGLIPHNSRFAVKMLYIIWIVDTVLWFVNFIASMAYFVVDANANATFGVSFFWLAVFSGLSFFSYYMLYTSARMEDDTRFNVSIVTIALMILINMVATFGITNFTAGFSNGVKVLSAYKAVGAIMVLVGVFFMIMIMVRISAFIAVIVMKRRHTSSPYRQELQA